MLDGLVAATRSRARVGVLRQSNVSYIEKVPGLRPSTSFGLEATLPAHPTALGQILLAFAPPGTVELSLRCGLPAYTQHTVTSPARFRRMLAVTKLTRVAISREEYEPGMCSVGLPVFGPDRAVVAGIEVTARDPYPDLDRTLPALAAAAQHLASKLTGQRQGDLECRWW